MYEPTGEELAGYISGLRDRLIGRRAALAELTEEVQRDERELHLWQEIARLRGIAGDGGEPEVSSSGNASRGNGSTPDMPSSEWCGNTSLTEHVVAVLRQSGKPMHIQDLMKAVRDRGVRIPGKGEPANLIANIRSFPGIVRPVRGMYGLREWGLVDKPPQARRTSRRGTSKGKVASSATRARSSRPSTRSR